MCEIFSSQMTPLQYHDFFILCRFLLSFRILDDTTGWIITLQFEYLRVGAGAVVPMTKRSEQETIFWMYIVVHTTYVLAN